MRPNELINIVSAAYPDGLIAVEYWDFKRERPKKNPKGGDTLALFIALEIKDTYDADATDEEQLETAGRAIDRARGDMDAVSAALTGELENRQRGKRK